LGKVLSKDVCKLRFLGGLVLKMVTIEMQTLPIFF
jgi:hypothetical protein